MQDIEDVDSWFMSDRPPLQSVLPNLIDVTSHLNDLNCTFPVLNHHNSGWQRRTPMLIRCNNLFQISRIFASTTLHNPNRSNMLLWLAYDTQLASPLMCQLHGDPFEHVELTMDKISFMFGCSAKCFEKARKLAIVIVECHHQQYRWTAMHGGFRKFKKPVKESQAIAVHTVADKLDALERKLDALANTQQLILNLLLQQQQQSGLHNFTL